MLILFHDKGTTTNSVLSGHTSDEVILIGECLASVLHQLSKRGISEHFHALVEIPERVLIRIKVVSEAPKIFLQIVLTIKL